MAVGRRLKKAILRLSCTTGCAVVMAWHTTSLSLRCDLALVCDLSNTYTKPVVH